MGFVYRQQVLPYYDYGLAWFMSHSLKRLPPQERSRMKALAQEVAGAGPRLQALWLRVTTERPLDSLCSDFDVRRDELIALEAEYYRKFFEGALP